jgi:PAS domain S-box-containing protein
VDGTAGTFESRLQQQAELALCCASAPTLLELCTAALPLVVGLTGAVTGQIVRHGAEDGPVRLQEGIAVPAPAETSAATGTLQPAPPAWQEAGVATMLIQPLPDGIRWLTLGFAEPGPHPALLTTTLAGLQAGLARLQANYERADLAIRVDTAQRLANMGDYDWHISTDTNRWSDQLFRIYGYEPGEINPSYERFLGLLHPDDRDRIAAIHQHAYATGESYEMIERIVRPDGELRFLASNGQVVRDDNGTPVRMRGTCVDVTERILAELAREQSAARFRSLVEACPQAILVVDADGQVLQANGRAATLLAGDPIGQNMAAVFPGGGAERGGQALPAVDLAGGALTLDVATARLSNVGDEDLIAAFLTDAAPRLANERFAASLREADVRRRQALELNDNVVQGLTAALLSLTSGEPCAAETYLDRTLTAARRMMNDWLDPLHGDGLQAGDLVRDVPSTIGSPDEPPAPRPAAPPGPAAPAESALPTVVVVDDNDDVRGLLALQVRATKRFVVVGEAADGEQAVAVVGRTQPDVVLLDLSMPRMDGLQALSLIRDVSPRSRVIVMSGFDAGAVAQKALAAGAVRYIEKGVRMKLADILDGVLAPA